MNKGFYLAFQFRLYKYFENNRRKPSKRLQGRIIWRKREDGYDIQASKAISLMCLSLGCKLYRSTISNPYF